MQLDLASAWLSACCTSLLWGPPAPAAVSVQASGEVVGEDPPAASYRVSPPPAALQRELGLDPLYAKCIDAGGFPVLGSAAVSDFALLEAAWIVDHMLAGRPDLRRALIESKTRLVVMAPGELTTDVPEHSDLEPKRFWDRRARGLGATRWRPAVSCGEENLLGYPGDPYRSESILVHEFAHTIHGMALRTVDPGFDERLKRVFDAAQEQGLWSGTYAATNSSEYWAEGVQSWFDTNREDDGEHNHVNTREELREHDLALAELVESIFGDGPWRYVHPSQRQAPGHLAGYQPEKAPRFEWPADLSDGYENYRQEPSLEDRRR